MHSQITLMIPHQVGHRPPPPVVELHDGPDREACVFLREADDDVVQVVGCPECLSAYLHLAAELVDAQLQGGTWIRDGAGWKDVVTGGNGANGDGHHDGHHRRLREDLLIGEVLPL